MTGRMRAAVRGLAKTPVFTAVAVVTLGVGVGVNTAAFGLFDAIAAGSLPFEASEELVRVALDLTGRDGPDRGGLTAADFLDFRAEPGLFTGLAGWATRQAALTGAGEASVVEVTTVTEGMFAGVLRVQPTLGRSFLSEEHRSGAAATVLLSHRLWTERLGADPSVLGRSIALGGEPHTIVGVMPPGFQPPFAHTAELWTAARPVVERCRSCEAWPALGRLAPETNLALAHERAEALVQRLAEAYPVTEGGVRLVIEGLAAGRAGLRGAFRLLFLATGLALLLACSNVATLLLARAGRRGNELRLRSAVGADRGRLIGDLVFEGVVLAVLASGVAVVPAAWGIEAFVSVAPEVPLPPEGLRVAPGLIAFNAGLALAAVLLFGLAPALLVTREIRGVPALRTRGGGKTAPLRALPAGLLTAQIALATALTVGSLVAGRALRDLRAADLGFDPDGVLALELKTARGSDVAEAHAEAVSAYLERVAELPGVLAAGATTALPLRGEAPEVAFQVGQAEGRDPSRGRAPLRRLSGAYLYALGQRIVRGRDLRPGDEAATPQPLLVNESFARAHLGYPRRDPLQARIALTGDGWGWRPVVGVVADVRTHTRPERPAMYSTFAAGPVGEVTVVIATDADPESIGASASGLLAVVAPRVATGPVTRLDRRVDAELAPERFVAALLAAFSVVALLLSGLGLFAVMSLSSRARHAEAGIRLALGAEADDLRRLVVTPGIRITLVGVLLGGLGAAWIAGLLRGVVPSAGAVDPEALGWAVVAILTVGGAAAWLPARRAASVDPASALRDD